MKAIATFVVAFGAASAIAGVTDSAISVYWLKAYDPKFRDAPYAAFEIAVWGIVAITLIGVAVAAVAAYVLRKRLLVSRKSVIGCCLFGGAYPLLAHLLPTWLETIVSPEILVAPVTDWVYLILFPVLAMRWIAPPNAASSAHAA